MGTNSSNESVYVFGLASATICTRRAIADHGFMGYILRRHSDARELVVRYHICTEVGSDILGSVSPAQLARDTDDQLKLMTEFAEGVEQCQSRTHDRDDCVDLAWRRAIGNI